MTQRADIAVLPLGALSAVVLGLEVFESRLVAYSVQVVVLYAVLGIALLGFGAAGSLVAVRRDWLTAERLPSALAWSSVAFSASIVIAHAAFVRLTPFMTHVGLLSLALSALLSLPFLCAGTTITLAMSGTRRIDSAYAANLIGSGLGCFLPLSLLGPLSGEVFLGLLALLAWLCSLPYLRDVAAPSRALLAASAASLLLALLSCVAASRVFPIQPEPEPMGQLAWQYRYAAENGITVHKRYDRWNPTGRIEIIQFDHVPNTTEPYPAMFYAQDSSAGSSLFGWDGRTKGSVRPSQAEPGTFVSRLCSETQYGQGYFVPRRRVLVIGLGGGPDVQCALYQEAQDVDVVEINRDSIAAVRGPLNAWVGGIGSNPRVHFHERDGRNFIRGKPGQYDLIQMSGVDTKNLMASGALALSENQLYTQEAFNDYFESLSPDGALSIIRFGEPEAVRLANTTVRALRHLGIAHPEQHVAMLRTGFLIGVIVRKTPWTATDAQALNSQLHPSYFRGASVFYYNQNGVPLDTPAEVDYLPHVIAQGLPAQFFEHVKRGSVANFARGFAFDIEPSTDDRPYFFDLWRYDRPETWQAPHVIALRDLLASLLILSFCFVLLPVRKLRERVHGLAALTTPALFACLGLGFIVLEVWLFHRFAMFLGHQIYSLSIVLATLLVSTGAGAMLGGRLRLDARRRALVGIGLVLLLLGVGAWILPILLERAAGAALPLRALITMAFVTPLGFALGLPFVAGLTWVAQRSPDSVPWCIGINGFASVVGSVAVVPLSMATGYQGVLTASAVLYAFAALASLAMQRADSTH
jgi:hypothetical protein